jgi:hypothetical protein
LQFTGKKRQALIPFMTEQERTIREHLRMMRDCRASAGRFPNGWHYRGAEDFLLRHGRLFSTDGAIFTGEWAGQCFASARMMHDDYPDYPYVEGIALCSVSGIPTDHAWSLTPDGRIFDRAWSELGAAYFGVAFNPPRIKAGQYPSMFEVTRKNAEKHPVFSVPWEENRWNPERRIKQ